MELIPITQVSKQFDVSTRTLRYYEQIGLIESDIKEDYAYRAYNERQLEKLKQVIILRKLRISLKQIMKIFENADMGKTLDILTENMREAEDEINYLSNIKDVLNLLIEKLKSNKILTASINFLDDSGALSIVSSLPSKKLMESKKMNDKKTDTEKTDAFLHSNRRLKDSEVRIITLPPATVASYQFEGEAPEEKVAAVIDDFVRKNDLVKIKPDLRCYGFNAPNPTDETGRHGYEMWVTIPDDFKVDTPLKKKKFEGGLYAAFMIPMGAFEGWEWLHNWAITCDKYMPDYKGGREIMRGCLEEHLNYVYYVTMPINNVNTYEDMQLDLLIPIKVVENSDYGGESMSNSMSNIKSKTILQLEAEAGQGDAVAQWDCGYCFFQGYNGVPVDYAKAVEWFQKSANQGYAKAQCTLGYCYENGLGVPKCAEKAMKLYEKSAMQNWPGGMINMGYVYLIGIGAPQDNQKAKFWFEKAAAQNENLRTKHQAESALKDMYEKQL